MMRKQLVRNSIFIILAFLLAIPVFCGSTRAETFRLTVSTGHPLVAIWVARMQDFFCVEVAKRVAERTKHKIDWNYAWGGAVAKMGENLEAVQSGLSHVALVSFPFEPTKLALHNFGFYTPFGSTDIMQVSKIALQVFDQVPWLQEVFEKQYNQKFLGGGASVDSYNLATTFPWKTLDDLQGKKIAAAGPNLTYVKAAGAVPVQSNLNEAYTSLQTGVYEGWVMIVDATASFKLYEIAKYYTFCGMGAVYSSAITMNLDKWKSLPKEVQDIMVEVAKEYTFDEAKATIAKAKTGVEVMKKAGVQFSDLSLDQTVKWANRMPNIPKEMAQKADAAGQPGTKVYKTYMDLLEKDGFKFPRRWELD